MNDNEVGRSYYNNYIRVGSYYGAQELKVKLTPVRYKLVFKSKSSSLSLIHILAAVCRVLSHSQGKQPVFLINA